MSGGHFDYIQYQVVNGIHDFSRDREVMERWPRLSEKLHTLSEVLHDILHDIDWDLSGDSLIEDDAEFEKTCLNMLETLKKL